MNALTQEFILEFNKLEKYLDTDNFEYNTFLHKLYELRPKNSLIKRYYDDLRHLGNLRNILVHSDKEYALPSPWSLDLLKRIVSIIQEPPTAWDIAIKNNIYTCSTEDSLKEVISVMSKNTYTHVPIYSPEHQFQGVMSESTFVQWLSRDEEWSTQDNQVDGILSQKVTIADVIDLCKKPLNDYWWFVGRSTNALEIEQEFLENHNRPHNNTYERLGIVLITENGKPEEKLLGLFTAWDLPKIKKYFE